MSQKPPQPQRPVRPEPKAVVPSCSACLHWRGIPGDDRGECRESSPSVVYVQKTQVPGQGYRIVSAWPQTASHEECGRFRARASS